VKLPLFIAAMLLGSIAQAAEPVGAVKAEVISANCVAKKVVGISALFSSGATYQCRLWIESEHGQEHINLNIDHEVKRGDKFLLVETNDGSHTLL
jgi:hypothetical protein